MGDQMDSAQNGILIPDSEAVARKKRRLFYHCGSHNKYSALVDARIRYLEGEVTARAIKPADAKVEIEKWQNDSRLLFSAPMLSGNPRRVE